MAGAAGRVRRLERRLEALLAAQSVGGVRRHVRGARRDELHRPPRADARLDHGPCACVGSRLKRGQNGQALGRSRGGFSTKIHLKTDFGGLPIAFHLTGGEASDSRNFETLLDIGPDLNPRAALGDKGYDSKSNRDATRQRGICPAIPYRSNTKDMPAFFPKTPVGKLKRFKRIALRCEKTAQNYGSF